MSWNRKRSTDRIAKYIDGIGEIEIKPMTREMDLENLSETKCREVTGAHVYGEIANLPSLVDSAENETERKRLVQAIHVFQREVARIASAVNGDRIHFQAARVHVLVYRPIGSTDEQARNAALAQLMIDRYGRVFAEEYVELPDPRVRSGSDHGLAVGTRNGRQGDRELLFLGSPANKAAKLLPEGRDRRLTSRVRNLLADDLRELTESDGDDYSFKRPTPAELADLLDNYGIDWSEADARQRLKDERKALPLSEIELAGASKLIDFDELTPRKSKYVLATTTYADVSGFTRYVEQAKTDDEKREALRDFHVIRKEMAAVIKEDFGTIRVQYQGDRAQAFMHLPAGDDTAIASSSIDLAAALQSSFEETLKDALPGIAKLGLAVGIGLGDTIATKLGERGHRDRICLGDAVSRAEHNEEHIDKQDVGIDSATYHGLGEDVQAKFNWDPSARCYVAHGLRADTVETAKAASALREGAVNVAVSHGIVHIGGSSGPETRTVEPARSWAGEVRDTIVGTGLVALAASLLAAGWLAVQRMRGGR